MTADHHINPIAGIGCRDSFPIPLHAPVMVHLLSQN